MAIQPKHLTLAETFALVKELNEKMHDVDGLSMIPHLTVEVTNTDIGGRDYEGRILFMGETVWDSVEDSHDPDEIKKIISDEILENERNLSLIAGQIKHLIGKQKW